jgi:hypothetical protein
MNRDEIIKVLKEAKKLAKLSEEELLEKLGQEVSKFENKFKPGDIICSDRFHNGLCMIVEKLNPKDTWEVSYTCQDLVVDHQKWRAYEYGTNVGHPPNNWRIATDDDIVKYLTTFLDIPIGKIGMFYLAKLTDNGIMLEDLMVCDRDFHLEVEELVNLKEILNKWVVE